MDEPLKLYPHPRIRVNRETLEETRALIKEKKKKKKKLNSSTRCSSSSSSIEDKRGGGEREGERQFRPRDERTRHGNSIEHAVIGN